VPAASAALLDAGGEAATTVRQKKEYIIDLPPILPYPTTPYY